jgi:hypothetical protein
MKVERKKINIMPPFMFQALVMIFGEIFISKKTIFFNFTIFPFFSKYFSQNDQNLPLKKITT